MRLALAFLSLTVILPGQSHPSWWANASPDATALVGIDWQSVRASPFGDPIEAELWGDLGFPDLPCLHQARQIIVSSPDMLALLTGIFSTAAIEGQAAKKNLRPMTYRGVDMWFATEKGTLSIARLNDQLVILGEPKTLQLAVDRTIANEKDYSPLLARAAKFAQKDLWVVAARLPDDLANRFVPLDTEAQGFEGSISLKNGLELDALISNDSDKRAAASADKLRQSIPAMPVLVRGLEVTVEDSSVMLALSATRDQVLAALRQPDPVVAPPEIIRVETPLKVERVVVDLPAAPVEKKAIVAEKPVEKPVEKVEKVPEKPQIIHIIGLDEGPREIVMPPVKPDKP